MATDSRLQEHRSVWERKPVLRAIYRDYHRRILANLPQDGPILEIGAGSGHLREMAPNIVSLDLLPAPWVDVAGDAETLPFADDSFAGLAMLDVLHHLPRPAMFFQEVARVLRPGGRLTMIEPGLTPVSWIFYNFFHQEDVDCSVNPLDAQPAEVAADPFASNQAIPTLLFKKQRFVQQFEAAHPELSIIHCEWLSLFAYPLSGGFKSWSLMPALIVGPMLRLEAALMPVLGPIMGFRLVVTVEHA